MNHSYYLQQAFSAARFAVGGSDPNPAVGAVLVNPDGHILGRGFTQAAGKPHAEVMAIRDAQAAGYELTESTIYITLEPCCHWGRTPPCTNAILAAGIRRVVIANRDFSPEVAGRSLQLLQQQGVEVTVLPPKHFPAESHFTLGGFSYRLRFQLPAMVAKWAQTADGYLAPTEGPSGAITSPLAHALVQRLRRFYPVVITGPGTVMADNPRLTRRSPYFRHNYNLAEQNFLGALLARFEEAPPTAAYEGPYWRYFILPRQFEKAQGFLLGNSLLESDTRLFAVLETPDLFRNSLTIPSHIPLVTQPSYPLLWNSIAASALQDGANAVFIETGPTLAQWLLNEKYLAALYVFVSDKSYSEMQWQQPRTLPLAQAIARGNTGAAETWGLKLRSQLNLGQEKLLYFATDAYWQP